MDFEILDSIDAADGWILIASAVAVYAVITGLELILVTRRNRRLEKDGASNDGPDARKPSDPMPPISRVL